MKHNIEHEHNIAVPSGYAYRIRQRRSCRKGNTRKLNRESNRPVRLVYGLYLLFTGTNENKRNKNTVNIALV